MQSITLHYKSQNTRIHIKDATRIELKQHFATVMLTFTFRNKALDKNIKTQTECLFETGEIDNNSWLCCLLH